MKQSSSDRWWDLPAALLLLAALATAIRRLMITEWTEDLSLVGVVAFLGVVAGLALGVSRFSSRQAAAIALVYGLFAIFWQLGLTVEGSIRWNDRVASLITRIGIGLDRLVRQEAVPDALIFLLMVSGLAWTLSAHAGYTLTRHGRAWRAVIPTGVAMLVVQTYDSLLPLRGWLLALYIFFALLLLARLAYLQRHIQWQEAHASLPPYLGLDLIRVILLPTALLILLAWGVPAMASVVPTAEQAWETATKPWDSVLEWLSNTVVSLGGEGGGRGGSYYGEQLALGRGNIPGETLILTVQTPRGIRGSTRYYWRARVYDSYDRGQWTSTISATQSINPAVPDLTFPEANARLVASFVFTSASGISTFYTPPQPLWVSHSARADLAHNPDGTADLVALHASPRLRAGETYQVRSSISIATENQLRAAGTDYPSWVTSRYLQLPPTVTPRTLELAREIAADLDNPYDIAVAVTAHLRGRISYSETIPPLDTDQEPLDWFLFDLRRGFCNYSASAEIVLLRSLGIPARLAVGFAQGTRQSRGNIYYVRQFNAHAWPEVYFPNLGWIELEPTASLPAISRPSGEIMSDDEVDVDIEGTGGGEAVDLEDRLEALLASDEDLLIGPSNAAVVRFRTKVASWAVLLALIAIVFVGRVYRRRGSPPLSVLLERGLHGLGVRPPALLSLWTLWSRLSPLGRAYLELNQALVWLGAAPDPSDTPAERVAALTQLLPAAAGPAQQLLDEYHITTYSLQAGSAQVARTASRAISRLARWPGLRTRVSRLLDPTVILARRLVPSRLRLR
jgi:transglutaminase-like putative cysteine protease